MDLETSRRSVLRHGAIVLLLGLLSGLPLAAGVEPARAWLGSHLTLLAIALLMLVTGLLWRDLDLSDGRRETLRRAVILDGYLTFVAGTAAALLAIPAPVATGQARTPAQLALLGPALLALTAAGLAWGGLLVAGLWGPGRAEASEARRAG